MINVGVHNSEKCFNYFSKSYLLEEDSLPWVSVLGNVLICR